MSDLPLDLDRTAWEREALGRLLTTTETIPPQMMDHFEVVVWGACHVLRLMRDTPPATALGLPSDEDVARAVADAQGVPFVGPRQRKIAAAVIARFATPTP